MRRVLLVTNDFPPRQGGIQTYLHELARRLPAERVVVLASRRASDPDTHRSFDFRQPFPVIRHDGLMAGQPSVVRAARRLLRAQGCDTVWFGAAAPLALTTPLLRDAGAQRVIASTHGHEVGWSMVPPGRVALRAIGSKVDVVTFVSRYSRGRFASAFGPMAAMEYLPCGVDTSRFRPDAQAGAEIRRRYRIGNAPVVGCVSRLVPRKGQDTLIRSLPAIRRRVPGAVLLLVGGGRYAARLRALAGAVGVSDDVVFTSNVPFDELPAFYNAADVFAMPCRTRAGGLDVEGLGVVYLEASACGLPVVAGRSGGAPETVREGETGRAVDGGSVPDVADAVASLLADRDGAAAMGREGRRWVCGRWTWDAQAVTLANLLGV